MQSLPLEILSEIIHIALCPRSGLLALSRTNQHFRGIFEPLLYTNISVRFPDSDKMRIETYLMLLGLYKTLRNNREKAALVRQFEVLDLP